MPSEQEWQRDKQRFVAWWQRPTGEQARSVADDRSGLWSPLARQFADLGRDLLAATSAVEVLRRVVGAAADTVLGTDLASVTLRGSQGLETVVRTDPRADGLDELQTRHGQGPAVDATDPEGTGLCLSADTTVDWPDFGPGAAGSGVRSALSVGIFPDSSRAAALTTCSREPRGLAAANPDVAVVLAAFAAAALASTRATTGAQLRRTTLTEPLRSSVAVERAIDLLTRKRHLPPEDVYDVLRNASAQLRTSRAG